MKIVENSKWLFDEYIQIVFDKLPEPFRKLKDPLSEEHQGGVIEDLWDVWYYYINSPVMRYVNNYYTFEKYDPRVFKKNMFRAIHYLCKLEQERLIETTRKMMAELSDYSEDNLVTDVDLNRYKIYFVWVAEPGACKLCREHDGKVLDSTHLFTTHWNCRCHLEQHIQVLSPEGEVISDTVKNL